MPFTGIADPAQLELLAAVLEEHCKSQNIIDDFDREGIAIRLVSLFSQGVSGTEELKAALESGDDLRRELRCA